MGTKETDSVCIMATTPYNQEQQREYWRRASFINKMARQRGNNNEMQLIFYLVQSQAVDHNCRICFPFDKMYDDIGYAATT